MSFLLPDSDWKPTPISDLPSWENVKRIGLDCETRDPSIAEGLGNGSLRDGYTVGWAFAFDNGPKHYLPFRHEGGGNLPLEEVLKYLRYNIKHFTGEYVGANIAYDYDYGINDGFEWHPDAKFRDVQIADPLINETHYSYSLKEIGNRWGIEAKDETLLIEAAKAQGLSAKGGLWRLHSKFVGLYGEGDVASPLELLKRQEKVIDSTGLREIFDLETDVTPVLVKIRRRGVLIDQDKLSQIETWAAIEEKKATKVIKDETGIDIGVDNIWKAVALVPALEEIGIKINKTRKGAPEINADMLKGIDHPVTRAILHARKTNKIRTTFAASIWRYMINGRIHCTFKQIASEDEAGNHKGVRYGRLSALDPNMQQQPNPERDPVIAGEWRKIFIPEPGAIWGCNDYSQQEPRWTTHFAATLDLPKAKIAAQTYIDDPSTDHHEMMTRLVYGDEQVDKWINEVGRNFKIHRGYAKAIFLGLCYGEGGAKLCYDINKPTRWAHISGWGKQRQVTFFDEKLDAMAARIDAGSGFIKEMAGEEGQNILDKFDAEVPYVGMLAKTATERASSRGFVSTIFNRHLHFEQRDDGSYEKTHKALNRIIQGSSADQVKLALIELEKAGHYIQLQVHDETDGSFATVADAEKAGDIMRDCVLDRCTPLVPFKVDTETGPSWGEIS